MLDSLAHSAVFVENVPADVSTLALLRTWRIGGEAHIDRALDPFFAFPDPNRLSLLLAPDAFTFAHSDYCHSRPGILLIRLHRLFCFLFPGSLGAMSGRRVERDWTSVEACGWGYSECGDGTER